MLTECFEKHFEKKTSFYLASQKTRDYTLRFHWYIHIFIEFTINFKRGRGQIVFSISHNNKETLANDLFDRLNFEQSFFKTVF